MRRHLAVAIDIDADIDAAEFGRIEPDFETALAALGRCRDLHRKPAQRHRGLGRGRDGQLRRGGRAAQTRPAAAAGSRPRPACRCRMNWPASAPRRRPPHGRRRGVGARRQRGIAGCVRFHGVNRAALDVRFAATAAGWARRTTAVGVAAVEVAVVPCRAVLLARCDDAFLRGEMGLAACSRGFGRNRGCGGDGCS